MKWIRCHISKIISNDLWLKDKQPSFYSKTLVVYFFTVRHGLSVADYQIPKPSNNFIMK